MQLNHLKVEYSPTTATSASISTIRELLASLTPDSPQEPQGPTASATLSQLSTCLTSLHTKTLQASKDAELHADMLKQNLVDPDNPGPGQIRRRRTQVRALQDQTHPAGRRTREFARAAQTRQKEETSRPHRQSWQLCDSRM